MQHRLNPPPMNPLSRLLAAVAGALALAAAFFFGFFILVAALAIGLIAWAVIWLRFWWIRRKLEASGGLPPEFGGPRRERPDRDAGSSEVIDAEYEVVSRSEEED